MISEKDLRRESREGVNPGGEKYNYLSVEAVGTLSDHIGEERRSVELAALKAGIIPERYQRSIGTVGINGQIKLLEARVGVAGCGGLGGITLEMLARMGVGTLVAVDDDTFADSNLNRQLLALEENLGRPKVEAAASRIKMVNSAVNLVTYHCRGDRTNLPEIFAGCNLVIDCLDNLHSRFDLEKACIKLNVPLVHGAIAGFLGQVAVIRPDKPLLASIYGSESDRSSDRGVERELGNPATTPSMIASWQVIEAVKYLARLDGVLPSGKMLIIDMYSGESYQLELSG